MGKKYRHKTVAWWARAFDAAIDGKLFKVYLNGKERVTAAKHATYGAYRKPGKGLNRAYVKPKGKLHHNTGAKGCLRWLGVPIRPIGPGGLRAPVA